MHVESERAATNTNNSFAPSYATLDLGARYSTKFLTHFATLRFQVINVTARMIIRRSPTATSLAAPAPIRPISVHLGPSWPVSKWISDWTVNDDGAFGGMMKIWSNESRFGGFMPGGIKPLLAALALGAITIGTASYARAETVEIYSAGSLRNIVEALAKEAGPPAGVDVKPTFGPSGGLRARIEGGEKPDLFLSADLGSPRKLADAGRTVVPAVAFAQNRMCLIARRSLGVTADNLVDRLLSRENRLKTSTPIVDPAGDYAVAIFDRIEAARKGAGQILRDKAQSVAEATKSAQPLVGHSAGASLFLNDQIDMTISYCSGAPAIEKEVPDVATLAFPPALEPQPVSGLAVLSTKPGALRLALYLMSEKGQAIVKAAGLLPILDPPR